VEDGATCADILDDWNLLIAQFFDYNPSVKSDCSGLWTGYQYCVRTPSYVDQTHDGIGSTSSVASSVTAIPASMTNSRPSSSAPVQAGQPTDCIRWYTAQAGDSCSSVADAAFVTLDQFYRWNPAVSSDCTSGFWGGNQPLWDDYDRLREANKTQVTHIA
jgi:hypothetical protein